MRTGFGISTRSHPSSGLKSCWLPTKSVIHSRAVLLFTKSAFGPGYSFSSFTSSSNLSFQNFLVRNCIEFLAVQCGLTVVCFLAGIELTINLFKTLFNFRKHPCVIEWWYICPGGSWGSTLLLEALLYSSLEGVLFCEALIGGLGV